MPKNLLIVESPAKAKTLKRYLGDDFMVLASYGHVRDLIPKNGAVEPEADFRMNYEWVARNTAHIQAIMNASRKAEALYLATDPDREGEAISWHILEILKQEQVLQQQQVYRVVFHEITERAIKQALQQPRDLSLDLVDAQQARRALDYLVGFNVSPLLWRKIQTGLSAGRVQSPALRMIVERDRAIQAFQKQEYWRINAQLKEFKAALTVFAGEKTQQFDFKNEQAAQNAIEALRNAAGSALIVQQVQAKERQRHPAAPFTTSTLQQEAARKLRFSAQRTMRVAQSLYEAGLITYMRTDSVTLADEALQAIRQLILKRFGTEFLPPEIREYKTKAKNAQEAHEAIRPTDVTLDAPTHLNDDERHLYDLIKKRTLASQMSAAILEQTSIDLWAGSEAYQFRATGTVLRFPGFMSVYLEDADDKEEEEEALLPTVSVGEALPLLDMVGTQHFTQPPPHYSEASLIKALEEYGIGRPSTYANIISTLLNREYVALEQRRFQATAIGRVVNDFLTQHFHDYVDYDFTAKLEDELDAVARGEALWKPLLKRFWEDLEQRVDDKKDIPREEVMQARELGLDPKSGKPVSARIGRFGPFVQIGSKDDEEKPRFASIPPKLSMDEITLEEALQLFQLPRSLGETEDGQALSTNHGRFGPFVRYGNRYVSIPKDEDPLTISRERALELIAAKEEAEAKKYIKTIEHEGMTLNIMNGRFGPYVSDGQSNASIPKALDPEALDAEQCLHLLAKARERRAQRASKKETAKKETAKKETAKKESAKSKKERSPKKSTASDEEALPAKKRGRKKKEEI